MKRTVDACVAIKWFVREGGEADAVALLSQSALLYAPELIFSEVTNTFWKKVSRAEASWVQFERACGTLSDYFTVITPSRDLMRRAGKLASDMGHPAYDCFYIACAELNDAPLVTADRRLLAAAQKAGFARHVTPLHA